jgi:hypothetical protein
MKAEARGLDVAYHHGNYLEVELGATFDLVLLIFDDFCALGPAPKEISPRSNQGMAQPGGALRA